MKLKDVLAVKPEILKKLCKGVGKIIQPLSESFDITFFSYRRIDKEGNLIFMTNHYPWLQNLIDKQYIQYLKSYHIQQDSILWDGVDADEFVQMILQDACDNFNIAHGITLVKHFNDYEEHFSFATTRDNLSINNFYMNSMPLLERFIIYFREKASDIIKLIENYSVNIKDIVMIKQAIRKQEFYREVDYFIENTNIKVIHLTIKSQAVEVNYTLARSGYLLAKGYSYKKIAKIMYVSPKTVEARLAKLRQLLHVANKKELTALLNEEQTRHSLELVFQ